IQTPITPTPLPNSDDMDVLTVERVKARFAEARRTNDRRKKEREEIRRNAKSGSPQNSVRRHKASQQYNRYRVIDRPPLNDNPKMPNNNFKVPNNNPKGKKAKQDMRLSSTTPIWRPRYSGKRRTRKISHDPPPSMKQYCLKPWKTSPVSPAEDAIIADTNSTKPAKKPSKPYQKPTDKLSLMRALSKEHPIVTLRIGTLSANVKRSLKVKSEVAEEPAVARESVVAEGAVMAEDSAVALEVILCIRGAVREANKVKRRCQGLLGTYIEKVTAGDVSTKDRNFLKLLCPPIETKNSSNTCPNAHDQGNVNIDDDNRKRDDSEKFIDCFMRHLYTGNHLTRQGIGPNVAAFIKRLEELKLYQPRDRSAMNQRADYTPNGIIRSVSAQLALELKMMYTLGTIELQEQLKAHRDKEEKRAKLLKLEEDSSSVEDTMQNQNELEIRKDWSPVENFIKFNRMVINPRRIAPMSPRKDGFVLFSEPEILSFFWARPVLKGKIRELVHEEFPSAVSLTDLKRWLGTKEPGFLIQRFLADVNSEGLNSRQKHRMGIRSAVKLWTTSAIEDHLLSIGLGTVDPSTYNTKGYVFQGSIKTNGHSLQLLGFKLKELQCVRYKQLPEDRLPDQLTSTVGGVDYFLKEIRNIVATKEDVARLWPHCASKDIKVLGLDLGQAFVAGVSALLPEQVESERKGKFKSSLSLPFLDTSSSLARSAPSKPSISSTSSVPLVSSLYSASPTPLTSSTPSAPLTPPATMPQPGIFHNLAVNQKAAYQPTFKHRTWMEGQKAIVSPETTMSVAHIESNLPSLRGNDASIHDYLLELERTHDQLDHFYNGDNMRFERHAYDASRAKEQEFNLMANQILKLVGGSIGAKRDDKNMVVIAIGLGQFAPGSRLSSLHGVFMRFFVPLARSLNYIVVGINEFYTSKKCPICLDFVAQVEIRRLYCKNCRTFFHRDVMAGHNIANIARGYLLEQERPEYLHPVDQDGNFPWKKTSVGAGAASSSSSTSASSTISTITSPTTTKSSTRKVGTDASTQGSKKRNPAEKGDPQEGRRGKRKIGVD
ncbi:hypothetical protein BGZ95_003941, partial [Linnemannia exigua]